jgi:hypothetical protein
VSIKNSDTTFQTSENPIFEDSKSNILVKKELSNPSDAKNFKFDSLTNMNIFGYGVGHFINDLAAAGWFNYLTIYLKSINPIDPYNAGFYAGWVLGIFKYLTVFV